MFDCPRPDAVEWYPHGDFHGAKGSYPTAPWAHVATAHKDRKESHTCPTAPPLRILAFQAWSPPDGRGEIRSARWSGFPPEKTPQGFPKVLNRLACGCVLYARIRIEQGVDRVRPGTHGRIFHLEAGDRIEMQFWLHVKSSQDKDPRTGLQVKCTLGGEGTEHVVRLDEGQNDKNEKEPCVQKLLFATAPWLKFTLVADKPESDHDVGHVPLRADQLPGLPYLSREGRASACCFHLRGCFTFPAIR